VPAMVALFGRANWWLPSGLARLVRVPASGQGAQPEPVKELARV